VSGVDHRRAGQALTEFALVLPILVVLVMAVFDFGRALFYLSSVNEAAKSGARIATVNQDADYICKTVSDGAAGIILPDTCKSTGVTGVAVVAECGAIDCEQTVSVTYSYEPVMPVLGALLGQFSFSSESTTHVERVCPRPCSL
jgi:Flp pilus assembly protein TadG